MAPESFRGGCVFLKKYTVEGKKKSNPILFLQKYW